MCHPTTVFYIVLFLQNTNRPCFFLTYLCSVHDGSLCWLLAEFRTGRSMQNLDIMTKYSAHYFLLTEDQLESKMIEVITVEVIKLGSRELLNTEKCLIGKIISGAIYHWVLSIFMSVIASKSNLHEFRAVCDENHFTSNLACRWNTSQCEHFCQADWWRTKFAQSCGWTSCDRKTASGEQTSFDLPIPMHCCMKLALLAVIRKLVDLFSLFHPSSRTKIYLQLNKQ